MSIIIKGLRVYENGDKNKQPIIFIHGFPYNSSMWENQIDALQNGFYCIRYDIKGLGNSSVGDGQYTMESFVDDLFDIMDKLKLEKPVICGLSMGGYISLRAIQRNQSKFGGFILLDSRAEPDDNEGKLKRANAIKQINLEGVSKFVENFVPNCFMEQTQIDKPKMYQKILEQAKSLNSIGVKGSLIAMLSRGSTEGFLSNINIPTLILVSQYDKLTPPEKMRLISEKITGSEFKIVPNAAHMSPLENPDFVNEEIKKFLLKHFA